MENYDDSNTSGPTILWDEMKGKKVKSVDGEKLGEIEKISQNHVMVEEGLIKKKRFWIPKFLADIYDGKFILLSIRKEEIKKRYYYDEEPAASSSQYDLDKAEFNTKYGKNKNSRGEGGGNDPSNEKIRLKEDVGLQDESKKGYENMRDFK
jgi:hypothetical protein